MPQQPGQERRRNVKECALLQRDGAERSTFRATRLADPALDPPGTTGPVPNWQIRGISAAKKASPICVIYRSIPLPQAIAPATLSVFPKSLIRA